MYPTEEKYDHGEHHYSSHTEEPHDSVEHAETFGDYHDGSDYERTYHFTDEHHMGQHWVEPKYEHDYRHEYENDEHFTTASHDAREVEYEIDNDGHVHMYEEVSEEEQQQHHGYNFLQ